MALHPCPSCGRHVRHEEPRCPFCASALPEMSSVTPPVLRVTRAAMWLGATLAVSACEQSQPAQQLPTSQVPSAVPNNAQPQLLPTQTTQTVQPQMPLQGQTIAPQQPSPQEQMLQQPQPNAVPAYGAAPPIGPADPGSHARRYGAPAFVPWDEA
ncbi:MAG: hypothetical protein JNK05_32450 [Myxococcales bacterium]|nr:hypothetical protein [Myxococcales bacterium]